MNTKKIMNGNGITPIIMYMLRQSQTAVVNCSRINGCKSILGIERSKPKINNAFIHSCVRMTIDLSEYSSFPNKDVILFTEYYNVLHHYFQYFL